MDYPDGQYVVYDGYTMIFVIIFGIHQGNPFNPLILVQTISAKIFAHQDNHINHKNHSSDNLR
jgi:hypothetical protein